MAKVFAHVETLMSDGGQGFTIVWAGTVDHYTDEGVRTWGNYGASITLGNSSPQTYNTNIHNAMIAGFEQEFNITVAQNDKLFITGKKFL